MNSWKYVGEELDLFHQARQGKTYWSRVFGRYLTGDVLEVGGGIGANVRYWIKSGILSVTLQTGRDLLKRLLSRTYEWPRGFGDDSRQDFSSGS